MKTICKYAALLVVIIIIVAIAPLMPLLILYEVSQESLIAKLLLATLGGFLWYVGFRVLVMVL